MSTKSLYRGYGAVTLPLQDTADTTLASLDPGRDILLALLKAAINEELGPRWTDAVAGTSLSGTSPVEDTLPQEPDINVMQQRKAAFPLLCVYRSAEQAEPVPVSIWLEDMQSLWIVDYILGPLNVIERRKASDAFQFVRNVIASVIIEGGHRAYQETTLPSGQTQSTRVLGPGEDAANFSEVRLLGSSTEPIRFAGDVDGTPYEAISLRLRIRERQTSGTGLAAPYTGSRHSYGSDTQDGEIEGLVSGDTLFWPYV